MIDSLSSASLSFVGLAVESPAVSRPTCIVVVTEILYVSVWIYVGPPDPQRPMPEHRAELRMVKIIICLLKIEPGMVETVHTDLATWKSFHSIFCNDRKNIITVFTEGN